MKKFVFLLFVLLPLASFAKTDPDFAKPLELSGDFLSVNLNSREGEYKGNFLAKQGSMKIEGNQIKIKQKQNKQLESIIASGKPVRFSKMNYQSNEMVNGSALKITYDANKLLITLEGNAEILSGSVNSFRSHIITYGLTNGEIKAVGNSQRRVQIVIPPSGSRESTPLVK